MNWDELFIRMAMLVAQKSKDPSTKVGCVIVGRDNAVLATGFNGFPRGVREEESYMEQAQNYPAFFPEKRLIQDRWDRPAKYSWVEHAERNAVYNAARNGVKISGARAYLNFEPQPCADCCRGLIQAGIVEIIGPDIPFRGVGTGQHYHIDYAKVMCEEAGVVQRVVPWVNQDFVRRELLMRYMRLIGEIEGTDFLGESPNYTTLSFLTKEDWHELRNISDLARKME